MHATAALALLAAAGLSHAAVEVTKTETVDLKAGTGELGWGAKGLPFGYEAGCGLNFTAGTNSPSLFTIIYTPEHPPQIKSNPNFVPSSK